MATATLSTPAAKRGRKPNPYKCAWDNNRTIDGLYKIPGNGNRWRIVATGERFTEPDPRLAVARFERWQRDQQGKAVVALPVADVPGTESLAPAVAQAARHEIIITPSREVTPDGTIKGRYDVRRVIPESEYIAMVRHDLLFRREWLARMTGVEQVAWLPDIKRPTASPTLEELGTLYVSKPGLSPNEAGRSKTFWKEFRDIVRVATVRELSHDLIQQYEQAILAKKADGKPYSPKSIKHRFAKVKCVLAYALKRGKGTEDCRRALDICAMLEAKKVNTLDPKPISKADFWNIYKAAEEAKDTTFCAAMMVALNAAMYGGEVAALKWEEVDLKAGELATRRPKTGVARVACLWPETVRALKGLEHYGDSIFYGERRSYNVHSVIERWARYRKAAGLGEEVTFGMIRDAAYSIACRTSSLDKAKVLAGHRLPGAVDHYVLRNPQFVEEACRAIRAEFFPQPKGDAPVQQQGQQKPKKSKRTKAEAA